MPQEEDGLISAQPALVSNSRVINCKLCHISSSSPARHELFLTRKIYFSRGVSSVVLYSTSRPSRKPVSLGYFTVQSAGNRTLPCRRVVPSCMLTSLLGIVHPPTERSFRCTPTPRTSGRIQIRDTIERQHHVVRLAYRYFQYPTETKRYPALLYL